MRINLFILLMIHAVFKNISSFIRITSELLWKENKQTPGKRSLIVGRSASLSIQYDNIP